MSVAGRLAQLLPHWIEHNESHVAQLKEWEQQAREAELSEAAEAMAAAARSIQRANEKLTMASKLLPEVD